MPTPIYQCVLIVATCAMIMYTSSAQQILGVSQGAVPVSGGIALTLYGTDFPTSEPLWIVFLNQQYDLVPGSLCAVDSLRSSSTTLVCPEMPPLVMATRLNVSVFQVTTPLFVGLKRTNPNGKYFLTSQSVVVTPQFDNIPKLGYFAGAVSQGGAIVNVKIDGIDGSTFYSRNVVSTVKLTGAHEAVCLPISTSLLTTPQQALATTSRVFPFRCPSILIAGFYSVKASVNTVNAALDTTNAARLLRYTPSLATYTAVIAARVDSVSPAAVPLSTPVTFTITGSGFGATASENTVTIGGNTCAVLSAAPDSIVCQGIATPTAPDALLPFSSGAIQRTFAVTQPAAGVVSIDQLRAATPSGDLISGSGAVTTATWFGDLAFPPGSVAGSTPFAAVFDFIFTAPISGRYIFYCASTDSAVLSLFSGTSLADICAASASVNVPFYSQPQSISTPVSLTQGATLKLRAAFGVSDATVSETKFSMSVMGATNGTVPVPIPHIVKVSIPRTSSGDVANVDIMVGTSLVSFSSTASCGSLALAIMQITNGNYATTETVATSASSCDYYLTVTGGNAVDLLVNTTGTAATSAVILQGSNALYFDSIPAYVATAPYNAAAFTTEALVSVTTNNISAYRSVNAPLTVATSVATPGTCSVGTTELATSGLPLNITYSTTFPVASPTVDLISYNGNYKSLGNALTQSSATMYVLTMPSALPSSAYQVVLDLGSFGRVSCGSIVQGFQAILITPTAGTKYGGTVLTITGSNFPTAFATDLNVTIGGAQCVPFYTTDTTILCNTSAMLATPTETPVSTTTSAATFFVRVIGVQQRGLPAALANYGNYTPFGGSLAPRFSYSLTGIPVLNGVTPAAGGGGSRNVITISGTSLVGSTFSLCKLDGSQCAPVSCPVGTVTSTSAICTTPHLADGNYSVVASNAAGRSNSDVFYTSYFAILSITPTDISPLGGSTLTIVGVGLASDLIVNVGGSQCAITAANDTVAVCSTNTPLATSPAIVRVRTPSLGTISASIPNSTLVTVTARFTGGASMPQVPYFVPTSGNGVGSTITVVGVNWPAYASDASQITIMIGSSPCAVTNFDNSGTVGSVLLNQVSNAVLIYCNRTASAQAGTDVVQVWLKGFGLLGPGKAYVWQPHIRTTYVHTLTVNSITPLSGSTAGGTYVTLTGLGFGSRDFTVTFGTHLCNFGATYPNTSVTIDTVVCVTSPATSQSQNTSEFIYIQSRDITLIYDSKYQYLVTSTGILTKASPLTGNAGTVITLNAGGVDPTNVIGLFIIGVLINLTYVPSDASFNAILPSLPAFRSSLILATTTGYTRSASSIVFVSYPTISSISPQVADSEGGTLITVNGQRFARESNALDNLLVIICGNACKVRTFNLTTIVCEAPPLRNLASLSDANVLKVAFANPLSVAATLSTGTISAGVPANVLDGDITTGVSYSSASNIFGVDLGSYRSAHLMRLAFFPLAGSEAQLVGATIQTSQDGSIWTTQTSIATVNQGWNNVTFRVGSVYAQYVRLITTSPFSLAEFQVFGVRGASTSVAYCPLIVTVQPTGSDQMTTCLQQPLLCSNVDGSIRMTYTASMSPTVTTTLPVAATTRGGTLLNLYGSFPTVTCTDITVVAGGRPCPVTSCSAAQIVCITPPAYVDSQSTSAMSVLINGYGYASITAQSFQYAESWSSKDAWSFGSQPTTGDLVIIPTGATIILDISPPSMSGLIIYGTLLTTSDVTLDIFLESGFIEIGEGGAFIAGTTANPFAAGFLISLAPSTHVHPVYGSSYLAVSGGTFSLCGSATSSVFGALSQTANVGDRYVSIAGITTWSSGSSIVIPSSTSSALQTEVRTVNSTAINGSNTLFYFNEPLAYRHLQGTESNALGLSATFTTFVGLLSRTVGITSSDVGSRGHVFVQTSPSGTPPKLTLYYAELFNLGQRGVARRHPLSLINIHVPGAVTLSGISIHDSANRGLYFENTQYITSSLTVVYNTVGHGISTDEFGTSQYLTITSNYVAVANAGEVLDPKASCYYFTNPRSTFTTNYAFGAAFAGFAFNLQASNTNVALCPQDIPFGSVSKLFAMSTEVGLTIYPAYAQRAVPCGLRDPILNPTVTTILTNLQMYRNRRRHIELGDVASLSITNSWLMDSEDAAFSSNSVTNGLLTLATTYVVAHSTDTLLGTVTPLTSRGIRGVLFPAESGNMLLSLVYFSGYSNSSTVPRFAMSACEECLRPFSTALPGYTNFGRGIQFFDVLNTMILYPPFNSIFVDMDGIFGSGSNATLLQALPHLYTNSTAGLPLCTMQAISTWNYIPSDISQSPLMLCTNAYSMHQVQLSGNFGAQVAVVSDYGATTYTTFRNSFALPGGKDVNVIIPSGTITSNGATRNISSLNFRVVVTENIDWDRTIVTIPNNVNFKGGQLGIRFDFNLSTYAVDAFARTRLFSAGSDLRKYVLNPSDSNITAISTYLGAVTATAPTSNQTTIFVTPKTAFLSVSSSPLSDCVPLIFDLTAKRCSNTGTCLGQTSAYTQTAVYPWTDIRSWPATGKIPVEGDTAVIPRGVRVLLASATPYLNALIIEGTLELHFRLVTSITANFIVINGGTLLCGTMSSPHQVLTTINLKYNPAITPMAITDTVTIQSGTLLNMGTVSLVGASKSVPWTSLGALLGASSSSITTSDVLLSSTDTTVNSWNGDDVVAVSSSNYNSSLSEKLVIAELATDNRGFTSRTPTTLQHDWYSMTVNDNTKITTASKLAVLNRTIVIRSAGPTPGCQVVFAMRPNPEFSADGILNNVQIDGCGYSNVTGMSTEQSAAVVVQSVRSNGLTISECAIHSSLASGLALFDSQGVTIGDNAIVDTVGSSLYFDGSSALNTVTGNLVMGTRFSKEILADPSVPRALCSYDSRHSLNAFKDNVAAGSDSEGYCVVLPSCDDSVNANTGNEAHSCVVGHFTAHTLQSSVSCVLITGFHAWHNSYMGLYSAVAADTRVIGSMLHDNHIDVAVGREGSGSNLVQSTIIGGRSGYFDGLACALTQCVANRLFGTCYERSEELRDGTRTFIQGEIGILVIPYLAKTPSAEYARHKEAKPFIRIGSGATSPSKSVNYFDNNVYYYWYRGNDYGRCSGSTTIATDGYSTLRLPTTMLSNSSWVTFNDDVRVYIHDVVSAWASNSKMCAGFQCDALLHVLINDFDGTFFSTAPAPSSTISHYTPTSLTCLENTVWNAYFCKEKTVGQLTVRDYGATQMDSYNIEPLFVRQDQHEDIVDVNYLPPMCATNQATYTDGCDAKDQRAHTFAPLIRVGLVYNLDFFVETPKRLRVTLDSCADPTARAQLNIRYDAKQLESVWVYDGFESNTAVQGEMNNDIVLADSPIGSYYYDSLTQRLRLLVGCGTTVEIHTVVYATVAMLINTAVEDFAYSTSDNFLANVSGYLVIPPQRLQLEAVYTVGDTKGPQSAEQIGSAVTVLRIAGDDTATYDPSAASTEVNNYVLSLIGYPVNVISNNIGFTVLQTVAAAWATELPTTVAPAEPAFGLTVGLIVSLAVVSFAIAGVIGFLQFRLFKAIISYTDDSTKDNDDEDELLAPPLALDPPVDVQIHVTAESDAPPTTQIPTDSDNRAIISFDVEHQS